MSKNFFGLDTNYHEIELRSLLDSLENRTPDEYGRYLRKLADIANPIDTKPDNSEALRLIDNLKTAILEYNCGDEEFAENIACDLTKIRALIGGEGE